MALFTETKYRQTLETAVLKWFAAEVFSFEQETAAPNCAANPPPTPSTGISLAGLLDIGTVMGKVLIAGGAPGSAVANAGNTGNGTFGAITADPGSQAGKYTIVFTGATTFNVFDPRGALVGAGTPGVAFATQLGFTITAGGTAFVAGDGFSITVGAATATANAGNTGNGTFGAITAQPGIQVGAYNVPFTAATKFDVFDPLGRFIGSGSTGTAFASQLGFTITAGGTAFVDGDGFTITVAAGTGQVVPVSSTAIDGSSVAMGVVTRAQTVPSNATASVVLLERQGVVLSDGLIWPVGASNTQIAAWTAQLAAAGIIARAS